MSLRSLFGSTKGDLPQNYLSKQYRLLRGLLTMFKETFERIFYYLHTVLRILKEKKKQHSLLCATHTPQFFVFVIVFYIADVSMGGVKK